MNGVAESLVGRAGVRAEAIVLAAVALIVVICLSAPAEADAASGQKFNFGETVIDASLAPIAPGPYTPGQEFAYQMLVITPGFQGVLKDFTLCWEVPSGIEIVALTPAANDGANCVEIGEFAGGVGETFAANFAVDATTPPGDYTIEASATATGAEPVSESAQVTVTPLGLTLELTGSPVIQTGDSLTMNAVVENVSAQTVVAGAPGSVCTDLDETQFSPVDPCGPFGQAGQSLVSGSTYPVSYEITSTGDGQTGTYDDTHTVATLPIQGGDTASSARVDFPIKSIPTGPPPTLTQEFSNPGPYVAGHDELTSTVTIDNTTSQTLTNIELCQVFPEADLKLTDVTPALDRVGPGRACPKLAGSIAPGGNQTATFTYDVLEGAGLGSFQLKAAAEAGPVPNVEADPISGDIVAGLQQLSTLMLLTGSQCQSGEGCVEGQTLTNELHAINSGEGPLSDVELCQDLPELTSYSSSSATPSSISGDEVCFTFPSIASGDEETVEVTLVVDEIPGNNAQLSNSTLTGTSQQTEEAQDQYQILIGTCDGCYGLGYTNEIISSPPYPPGSQVLFHTSGINNASNFEDLEVFSYCVDFAQGIVNLEQSDPDNGPGVPPGTWCSVDTPTTTTPGTQSGGVLEFEVPASSGPGVLSFTASTEYQFALNPTAAEDQILAPVTETGPSVVAQSSVKTLPTGPYDQSDPIEFNLYVANSGTKPLTNVEVCDTISSSLTYDSSTGPFPATVQGDEVCYQVGDLAIGEVETIGQRFTVAAANPAEPESESNALAVTSDQADFNGQQPFTIGTGSFTLATELVDPEGNEVSPDEITPDDTYAFQATVANNTTAETGEIEICVPDGEGLINEPINWVPIETAAYADAVQTSTGTARCVTVLQLDAGQTLQYEFPFVGDYPYAAGTYDVEITADGTNGEDESGTVDYEIIPVPYLTATVGVDYPDENQAYAGSDVRFDLEVENDPTATANAENVNGCLSLTNTLIGLSEGNPCITTTQLSIGQSASGSASYAIPYYATGHGLLGQNSGEATLCATASNSYDEPSNTCGKAAYAFNVRANPAYRSNNANNVVTLEPTKREVKVGEQVKYKTKIRNNFFAGSVGPGLSLPLFDTRLCHKIPPGLELTGATRPRESLDISATGRRVCAQGGELVEGAEAGLALRYRVAAKAPSRVRSKATLTAAGVGGPGHAETPSPGQDPKGEPVSDKAPVVHVKR